MPSTAFAVLTLASAVAMSAEPSANAPIGVHVTSSLQGEKGLGRILSAAGRGDVDDTAREVQRLLRPRRWVSIVADDEAEVLITVESRERSERLRVKDKEGRETIEHRYRADAAVEIGRRRTPVRVEHDFKEGPYSVRRDQEQFDKLAEKLVEKVSAVIMGSLDELRPDRVAAGFTHSASTSSSSRATGWR